MGTFKKLVAGFIGFISIFLAVAAFFGASWFVEEQQLIGPIAIALKLIWILPVLTALTCFGVFGSQKAAHLSEEDEEPSKQSAA